MHDDDDLWEKIFWNSFVEGNIEECERLLDSSMVAPGVLFVTKRGRARRLALVLAAIVLLFGVLMLALMEYAYAAHLASYLPPDSSLHAPGARVRAVLLLQFLPAALIVGFHLAIFLYAISPRTQKVYRWLWSPGAGTCLHAASGGVLGDREVARDLVAALLAAGADPTCADAAGRLPWQLAYAGEDLEMAQRLRLEAAEPRALPAPTDGAPSLEDRVRFWGAVSGGEVGAIARALKMLPQLENVRAYNLEIMDVQTWREYFSTKRRKIPSSLKKIE